MMERRASSRGDGFFMCTGLWSEAGGPKEAAAQLRVSRRPRGDAGPLPASLRSPRKALGILPAGGCVSRAVVA